MRGRSCEERTCALCLEPRLREGSRRAQSGAGEPGEEKRTARNMDHRAHQLGDQLLPVVDERLEEAPVGVLVDAEVRSGLRERASEQDGGPVLERMRKLDRRLDQVELEAE
jgi:hypothetical protein